MEAVERRGGKRIRITAALLAAAVLYALLAEAPPVGAINTTSSEMDLVALTNVDRTSNGLPALDVEPRLATLARARSQDMALRGYFDHYAPPTRYTVFDLMGLAGLEYDLAGENIAWNNAGDDQTVAYAQSGFMRSQGHRANILNPRYTRIGTGAAPGQDARKYYAVLFSAARPSSADWRYFPETGHNVGGAVLRYLDEHGGVERFGLPRTELMAENGRVIQAFERQVLELWPENPEPFRVEGRLLGRLLADGRRFPGPDEYRAAGERLSFPETGYSVAEPFLDYWREQGDVAYFGYPISPPLSENGFQVQWFERARLEYHPEFAGTPFALQLGLLGNKYLAERAHLPRELTDPVAPHS